MKNPDTRKQLTGQVSLARWHGAGGSGWHLSIRDEASGLTICEAELSDAQLGGMIGAQISDIPLTYWANPNIGKTHEHDHMLADLTIEDFPSYATDPEHVKRLAPVRGHVISKAQEAQGFSAADGWRAENPDTYNGHRRGPTGYMVHVNRYVDGAS